MRVKNKDRGINESSHRVLAETVSLTGWPGYRLSLTDSEFASAAGRAASDPNDWPASVNRRRKWQRIRTIIGIAGWVLLILVVLCTVGGCRAAPAPVVPPPNITIFATERSTIVMGDMTGTLVGETSEMQSTEIAELVTPKVPTQ